MATTIFPANPEFTAAQRIGLAPIDLEADIPEQFRGIAPEIFHICHLTTALRALQHRIDGRFFDESASDSLRLEIARSLDQCALNSPEPDLSHLFHQRALDFTGNTYLLGPQLQAAAKDPFLELILGPIPSWRFPKHPRLFGCLFALRKTDDMCLIDWENEVAASVTSQLFSTIDGDMPLPSSFPTLAVCDLLVAGGELLGHPLHIANFLPSDEGVFQSPATKTIVYRNLYTQRYVTVTAELAAHALSGVGSLPVQPDAWNHLIVWFRGHDIGHCYFDSQLKKASALERYKRYVLQELVADIFGLLFSLDSMTLRRLPCADRGHQVTQFLCEALRYSLRDPGLFPDAAAAMIQLNHCIRSGSLQHVDAGRLEFDSSRIIQDLEALLVDVVVAARASNVEYLNLLLHRHLQQSSIKESLTKLRPSVPCTDVYPRFKSAEALFAADVQTITRSLASRTPLPDFAERPCRKE